MSTSKIRKDALFATTDPGAWILVPFCGGGLLAVLVFALLSSIVETFTSATWTLVFRTHWPGHTARGGAHGQADS